MRARQKGEQRVAAALGRRREDGAQRVRVDRVDIVEVADGEGILVKRHLHFASLQNAPIVVAQHRQQHGVAVTRLGRVPFDVEKCGIAPGRTIFQHILPPGVLGADRHMVGNHIEHLAQPGSTEGVLHSLVRGLTAQLVVDAGVIDYVIPVGAARRRLQVGRGIQVADAQFGQIPGDFRGIIEGEFWPKLNAVGSAQVLSRHYTAPPASAPVLQCYLPRRHSSVGPWSAHRLRWRVGAGWYRSRAASAAARQSWEW